MNGTPSQFYLLGNAIQLAQQNHRVVSQNIANVNTPHYKALELSFSEVMQQMSDTQVDRQFMENVSLELTPGLESRNDGNNVDLDEQLGKLKKNALVFQSYSHLLASKMATMRSAITG